MKYLKHIFKEIGYSLNDCIRRICGGLSEDARLIVILSMLLIFTVGNLYFSISTIYNWGREDGLKSIPEVRHIEKLELVDSSIDSYLQDMDSINQEQKFE